MKFLKKLNKLGFFMMNNITDSLKSARDRMLKINTPGLGELSCQSKTGPAILFMVVFFFNIVYQLAMQPGWALGGEMWAEMATNYFPNANSPSYFQKLFATDSGYIPAPQRLIALVANIFNLPASCIPYFYTWSAIILTGMMVGVFCLTNFRAVIRSDALRFTAAISVLIVADFETRTFINFTYFSAFSITIVTALALVDDAEEVPKWAWFIPLMMVSKPAILATLPAMIVVATVSKSRFRWITIVAILLCIGQIAQMVISQRAGAMTQVNEISFISKSITSFKYFFGFLGGYIFGRNIQFDRYFSMLAGLVVLLISGFVVFKKRNNSRALIFLGVLLLLFNVVLNSFALSDSWGGDMSRLEGLPIYRHIIVGFFGCILVAVGLFDSFADHRFLILKYPIAVNFGVVLFILWFVGSGWLLFGTKISREPASPLLGNSHWRSMAKAIDSTAPVLCVPIDPFSWLGGIYGRNCTLLNPEMDFGGEYRDVVEQSGSYVLNFSPPKWVNKNYIVSIGILVKPVFSRDIRVSAKARFFGKTGEEMDLVGERDISFEGGMLLFSGLPNLQMRDIDHVRLTFNVPVSVRYVIKGSDATPAILWMGKPVSKIAEKYEGKIIHQIPAGRGKDDGLFFVKDGLRRWISDAKWIERGAFSDSDIVEIEHADFISIFEDTTIIDKDSPAP